MRSASPLNIAIIGTGSIADQHAAAIRDSDLSALKAVCSSSAQRAWEAAERFGVKAYSDYQRMLQQEKDLDAVIIATASGQHLEPTLACARAGCHVISEKPLEIDLQRADRMIEACRQGDVHLACIFQNRYSDDFLKMKAAVQSGQLGRIVLGNAYIKWYRDHDYYAHSAWRGTLRGDGGAAFINQGIHTIDLLQHLLGPVNRVYAQTRTLVHDIEGEDVGAAILEFAGGAIGTIEASTAAYPGRPEQLAVYGQHGCIILEGGRLAEWVTREGSQLLEPGPEAAASGASDPTAIGHALHRRQLDDIFQALLDGRPPEVSGEEGRKALQLVRAIYRSANTGEPVDMASVTR